MKTLYNKMRNLRRENGFTIAELLVAMVVFAVLAAFVVPVLLNQRGAVDEGELKADLVNAATNVEESKVDNGGRYPDTLPDTVRVSSDDITLKYTYPYDRTAYCLQIISGSTSFFKSSASNEITTTDCTYEYVVPSTKLAGHMNGYSPVLSWNTVATATGYVIYKNNIPVKTVTLPTGTSAKSTSYTLPDMTPTEKATFHIIVKNGETASPQSNSVTLTAPVPAPTTPEIRLISSEAEDSTTQRFVIGWNAIRYAENYEVYDVTGTTPVRLAELGEAAGTYTLTAKRGESMKVSVKAVNTEGASGSSNTLTLGTQWPESSLVSGTSDPATGKIKFVFQESVNGSMSPDWGNPDFRVRLKVVEATTGNLVFDQSGITGSTYTPSKSFNRLTHRATVIVTTSTGVVLGESQPITVEFPKPTKPAAVSNLTSTTGGEGKITPNRLKWSAVTCSTSSTPEYFITHDGSNSGWVTGTYWNIPADWLAQGSEETFDIVARCTNANGDSSNSDKTSTTFTTGLETPATPAGLKSANKTGKVSWNAVTCATGSSVEYSIKQSVKNSDNVNTTVGPLKTTSYDFGELMPGSDNNFSVAARCVQYTASGTVKAASSWSAYSDYYQWETPLVKPAKPVVSLTKKEYASPTEASYRISWTGDRWASTYKVYDASNDRLLVTTDGDTTETTIRVKRGTTMNIYVQASNRDFISDKSSSLALSDSWPAVKILETVTDPYEGTIYTRWQTKDAKTGAITPDWGNPGYSVYIEYQNLKTEEVVSYSGLERIEFQPENEFDRDDHKVTVIVTTATGEVLASDSKTVNFPPPGPPAAVTGVYISEMGPATVKPNRIVWKDVSCGKATPEYLITNDGQNSGWVRGTASGTNRYFNVPESWLKQGFREDFTIVARCVNPAGPSDNSPTVSTGFIVDINTPAAVKNVRNNGTDIVSWDHVTAPAGLSREYQVSMTTKDGKASTATYKTTDSSLLLKSLAPDTKQVAVVQVRFYNPAAGMPSSTWSDGANSSTTWVTPKPTPAVPVLKLGSSNVKDAKTQEYTLTWNATEWSEGYKIVDEQGNIIKDVTDGLATSTKVELTRGIAAKKVAIRAYNTSATSNASNFVSLHAPWTTPEIKEINAKRDGTVELRWQDGSSSNPTPDWGTPGYKVAVEIRDGSSTGAVVWNASGIASTGTLTTSFASDSALRNKTYYGKITVTTATGAVLNSAWETIKFERPANPGRAKNVSSDNKGTGPVKNDRLTWQAVTCSQANSRAEYWVGSLPAGKNYYSAGTEKKTIRSWTADTTNVVIPQSHIVDMQGETMGFIVLSRCVFTDNGDASSWTDAIVDGDGYHEFTIGIAPPVKNPGTPTRDSQYNNTVDWTAATCGTGTYPEYQLTKTTHNGAASTQNYTTTNLTYALPSITKGTDQDIKVRARCIKTGDASKLSGYGSYSSLLEWRAPLPKPATPVVSAGAVTYTSATAAQVNVSWAGVTDAEQYLVYENGTLVKTLSSSTNNHIVSLTRGNNSSYAKTITVKAGNFTYPASSNSSSNSVKVSAPWPGAKLTKDPVTDQNRKATLTWQSGSGSSRTPNWGNDSSKVAVYAKTTGGTTLWSKTGITGNSIVTDAIPGSDIKVNFHIVVTTANGESLTSPVYAASFDPPAKPAAVTGLKAVDGSGAVGPDKLTWTAVTCPTTGSSPMYYVTQYAAGSTTTRVNNTNWVVTTNSYTIPQSWLDQGKVYQYGVFVRCESANGVSSYERDTTVTAARTNVVPPSAPTGLKAASNNWDGTARLTWNAVTCPSHLTAGYAVYFTKISNAASTRVSYPGTNRFVDLEDLDPATSHTAYVKARCYDASNSSITSTWASAPASPSYSWTTPNPIPDTPEDFEVVSTVVNSSNDGQVKSVVSWTAAKYALDYSVYTASGSRLATVTGTSATIYTKRGEDTEVYVVSNNDAGTSPESSSDYVLSEWPDIELNRLEVWSNNMLVVGWDNKDWGSDRRVTITVSGPSGYSTYTASSTDTARTWIYSNTLSITGTYTAKVSVRTSSGHTLTSGSDTVYFVKPPSAPSGLKHLTDGNNVQWNAVSCSSGTRAVYQVLHVIRNGTTVNDYESNQTSTKAELNMSANKAQRFRVRALCENTSNGVESNWGSWSSDYNFTSLYEAPTGVTKKPTFFRMNDYGAANTSGNDRIYWDYATCPAGSSPEYLVRQYKRDGVEKEWYATAGWGLFTYGTTGSTPVRMYDIPSSYLEQGSYIGWKLWVRCKNQAGASAATYVTYVAESAPVSAPSAPTNLRNGSTNSGTLYWNAVSCPSGTKANYTVNWHYYNSGQSTASYWSGWQTGTSYRRGSLRQGNKQQAYVQASCVGASGVRSGNSAKSSTRTWNLTINKPTNPRAYAGWWAGKSNSRIARWEADCPAHTAVRYSAKITAAWGSKTISRWDNGDPSQYSKQDAGWGSYKLVIEAQCYTNVGATSSILSWTKSG